MSSMRSILFLALLFGADAMTAGSGVSVNPVRRVVNMLQAMSKKITAEGEKEKELYDRFMCYCKTGGESLTKSIEDAEVKIPELESAIEETGGEVLQLKADVKNHKADREAAKDAIAEATAIREKEAAEYAKAVADAKANLDAMTKAISALEKGMGNSFLQTSSADTLRRLVANIDLDDGSRDQITSFLSESSKDDDQYAPASGEIVGILKQMKDTQTKDLADTEAVEAKAKKDFEALVKAKTAEIDALTKMIEEKTARIGEAGVEVVNMMDDLDETKEALAADKEFLANLEKDCSSKKGEWEERSKTRNDELLALAETIKILNDDDALELFKKTLPSPSLLQITVSSKEVTRQVQEVLRHSGSRDYRLDLISLALHGKKVSFDKVIGMIDDMVSLLLKEQKDDENKKAECAADLDASEDKLKELERHVADLEKSIADTKASIEAVTEELAALAQGIIDLDKQVAEATENRKEEHEDYVQLIAEDTAAKELLDIAKNRLNKFYNPKMYKAPPKKELTAEESIYSGFGGDLGTTPMPGGIANTGVSVSLAQKEAPPPPPETWDAYAKKSEESTGVISMIDILIKDLTKEMQEAEFEEKEAQADYEKFMEEAADKRTQDSAAITEKESVKADLEAKLQKNTEEKKDTMVEAMATDKTIQDLHAECDWLIKNFDIRKEARAGEVDSLQKAKAILSGADYSFVQTSAKKHLRTASRV